MSTIVTLDEAGRVVIPKTLRDEPHLELRIAWLRSTQCSLECLARTGLARIRRSYF